MGVGLLEISAHAALRNATRAKAPASRRMRSPRPMAGLPDSTVKNMVKFMDRLRGMHAKDALAFEVCVRHVASIVEDQRREEGHADPRDDRGP